MRKGTNYCIYGQCDPVETKRDTYMLTQFEANRNNAIDYYIGRLVKSILCGYLISHCVIRIKVALTYIACDSHDENRLPQPIRSARMNP